MTCWLSETASSCRELLVAIWLVTKTWRTPVKRSLAHGSVSEVHRTRTDDVSDTTTRTSDEGFP